MKKSKNEVKYLFIRRPKLAIVVSLVITLAGILFAALLPLEEYPSITPPQVVVSATYPGASGSVVEQTLAAPIEEALNGAENMLYMQSTSQTGSYSLTIYFAIGTNPSMNMVNIQNKLQLVMPRLPEEARRFGVQVRKSTGGAGILMAAVSSPDGVYDPLYVANYSIINIESELDRIPGTDDVTTFGGSQYAMRIWLDVNKINNFGIDPDEVLNAVRAQNTQAAPGGLGEEPMINKQSLQITMRTPGRLVDPKQFEDIIVRENPNGSKIRLRDIGRVELGSEDYTFFSRINGARAAILSVKKIPEGNSINC